MSQQITTATIQSYTNMVMPLLQQKGSKVMNKVWKKNFTGKAAKVVEQIGKQVATEHTTRHGDTVYNDTPQAARWLHPRTFSTADLIDNEDKLKMLIEATPAYAESQVYAIGRKIDEIIVNAALGTAYTGENGSTTESFSATYQIAAGGTGLTFDKVRDARRLLMKANWDSANDPLIGLVASQQFDDLMGMTQYTNADYNGSRAVLTEAGLVRWMGIEWVGVSDDIMPLATSTRSCIVMARSGLCLGMWDDVSTKIDVLPTKRYATQVFTSVTANATRVENGRIIEIQCAE